MTKTTKVLFRMESGPHIGLGHLQRSLALAAALRQGGVESLFLTNEDDTSRKRVERFGFPMDTLSEARSWTPDDVKATVEAADHYGCNAIVVDSHDVNAEYLAQLRDAGIFMILRDDLARYPFPCQVVFNGNADAPLLPYCSSSEDTTFLLGPEYIVLRPEFEEVPPRVSRAMVQNVLVILGGTDHYNLMPQILGLLDQLPGDFTVTAVVGPFFRNVAAVKLVAENAKRSIRLVHSPDSVLNLMLEADLVISAAGQTLYELACVGCPTVGIRVASNQDGQFKALAEAGCLVAAGDAGVDDVIAGVREVLWSLLLDPETRASMAAVGQRLVDGKGALRVARRIMMEASSSRMGTKKAKDATAFSSR